ncbi:MAG TPA: hypothetical protein VFL83_14695 [Anaeromyxobacter sp.]|nr:hypothetical protein [Anaeromyxobacter sp.]
MSPNPTALRHLVKQEEVDEHRCVSCTEYDDCLDAALRQSWRSWSCGQCALFRRAREQRAAELAQEWTLRPVA